MPVLLVIAISSAISERAHLHGGNKYRDSIKFSQVQFYRAASIRTSFLDSRTGGTRGTRTDRLANQQTQDHFRNCTRRSLRRPSRPALPGCRSVLGPSMEERRVTFPGSKGSEIVATWQLPEAAEVVVLCHGLGDHKDCFHLPALAAALAAAGFGSLRLDFPGNGESPGTFRYANMRDEAEDMRAAVEYLRGHGKTVVGLLGHSKAGSGVILYAAKYDDIPRVINVSGRFDNQRGITDRFGTDIFDRLEKEGQVQIVWPNRNNPDVDPLKKFTWSLTKEDMHNRMTLDMDPHSRAIKRSRVFTIHGSADATIPVEDAQSFHERIANSELCIVDGADHNYKKPEHAKILIEKAVKFLAEGKV